MTVQEFLEFLDGNGIVVTDEDLVEVALGWFEATLESIVKLDDEEL
jgi:hypothetical protein